MIQTADSPGVRAARGNLTAAHERAEFRRQALEVAKADLEAAESAVAEARLELDRARWRSVPCPVCHAQVDEACDSFSLGPYASHPPRVQVATVR